MLVVPDASIALVVTSPPYPMIEMWDDLFVQSDPRIRTALDNHEGWQAFTLMHSVLDPIWQEIARVVMPGGIVCINIGDATRTIGTNFQLYPSHAQIISRFATLGFHSLPEILWRKPTNSPTKFLGSGMLPPNAYVTLEHEFILIFRKGSKREFPVAETKKQRRESAYWWEERNEWFSDVWEFRGARQNLIEPINQNKIVNNKDEQGTTLRTRSAAFPFDLAYRLINMFSIKYDTILDPFLGTGTTSLAAMVSQRHSVGFELDSSFQSLIDQQFASFVPVANLYLDKRIQDHLTFLTRRNIQKPNEEIRYSHSTLPFSVITAQERDALSYALHSITSNHDRTGSIPHSLYTVDYHSNPVSIEKKESRE